jgi:predicted nucleic acid-binding protein
VILVDSSVWIDLFNGVDNRGVLVVRENVGLGTLLVGDLMLAEVLQGFGSEREAALATEALEAFKQVAIVDAQIAKLAAANYRRLRRQGITIRKTIDLLIATRCIDKGWLLLHNDRDFEPLREHLGLRTVGH